MNLRLACTWVRGELLERALHRVTSKPERLAEEEANWEAAVAEVDGFLTPEAFEVTPEVWADPEWVAAMGGEVAAVS